MAAFQLDGGEQLLASGGLISLAGLGWVANCLATADSTIDIRCCSSSAVALSTVFVLLLCADLLYFCILAATCCDTSVEICLDLVGLPGTRGFSTYEGLCASGLFCRHSLNSWRCSCVSFLHS